VPGTVSVLRRRLGAVVPAAPDAPVAALPGEVAHEAAALEVGAVDLAEVLEVEADVPEAVLLAAVVPGAVVLEEGDVECP